MACCLLYNLIKICIPKNNVDEEESIEDEIENDDDDDDDEEEEEEEDEFITTITTFDHWTNFKNTMAQNIFNSWKVRDK